MKLYHGTKADIWAKIQVEGITRGYFGTDTLYSLAQWSEDGLLLQVEIDVENDDRLRWSGIRTEKGMACGTYTLRDGCVIQPQEIRLISLEELAADIAAVKSMTNIK